MYEIDFGHGSIGNIWLMQPEEIEAISGSHNPSNRKRTKLWEASQNTRAYEAKLEDIKRRETAPTMADFRDDAWLYIALQPAERYSFSCPHNGEYLYLAEGVVKEVGSKMGHSVGEPRALLETGLIMVLANRLQWLTLKLSCQIEAFVHKERLIVRLLPDDLPVEYPHRLLEQVVYLLTTPVDEQS